MAGMSRYLQREILDHVNGTGYERIVCDTWDAASDADPSVSANTGAIDFGTAGSDWGVVTRFAIYDALTGGNLLWDITALTASKTIEMGDPVTFDAGDLVLTQD